MFYSWFSAPERASAGPGGRGSAAGSGALSGLPASPRRVVDDWRAMFPDNAPRSLPVFGKVQFARQGQRLIEVPPISCPLGDHELARGELLIGWSGEHRRYDCTRCNASWCVGR